MPFSIRIPVVIDKPKTLGGSDPSCNVTLAASLKCLIKPFGYHKITSDHDNSREFFYLNGFPICLICCAANKLVVFPLFKLYGKFVNVYVLVSCGCVSMQCYGSSSRSSDCFCRRWAIQVSKFCTCSQEFTWPEFTTVSRLAW